MKGRTDLKRTRTQDTFGLRTTLLLAAAVIICSDFDADINSYCCIVVQRQMFIHCYQSYAIHTQISAAKTPNSRALD